jgi:hypothetical protein
VSDDYSRDAQRYLDGEPHGDLTAADRAAADRLAASVGEYVRALPPLDARLDDAVMAAVRTRAAPRPRSRGWRWLVEPQPLRVRPIWAPALAAAAVLALWLAGRWPGTAGVPGDPLRVAAVTDTVYVRFQLAAPDARVVAVAGSFNDWRADALPMLRDRDGVWTVTVPLPVGEHRYQFVVDGARWRSDPTAHAQVDDGFGGANSVIVVGARGLVRS